MRMTTSLMAGLLWSHVAMMSYAIFTSVEYDHAIQSQWLYTLLFIVNTAAAITMTMAAINKKFFSIAMQMVTNLMLTSSIVIWSYGTIINSDAFIFSLQRGMRYLFLALLSYTLLRVYNKMVWSEQIRKGSDIRGAVNDILIEQEEKR